jgi:hypothetical protein
MTAHIASNLLWRILAILCVWGPLDLGLVGVLRSLDNRHHHVVSELQSLLFVLRCCHPMQQRSNVVVPYLLIVRPRTLPHWVLEMAFGAWFVLRFGCKHHGVLQLMELVEERLTPDL